MTQQDLRNALTNIEDEARKLRNMSPPGYESAALTLIARLTQIVREEIVK